MRRMLGIVGGLALGVCFSQFPEYAQQYTQRLGGAVDELQAIAERFDSEAQASGLTREQALATYRSTDEQFLNTQGETMAHNIARYEELRTTLQRISGATALERFNLMPQFFDSEIGGRTLDNYKPAVPVTVEGILYAAFGFLLGYAVVSALVSLVTLPFRYRRPKYRTAP